MTKRELKRQAMLRTGQLLFNSDWAGMFDASDLPETCRDAFIEEVQDIGWRLQERARRLAQSNKATALAPHPSKSKGETE